MYVKTEAPLRVLVTGATGFIASHLIRKLRSSGKYRVRGTVRNIGNVPQRTAQLAVPNSAYPLELVEADLNKDKGWKEAVQDCTFVYHVASPAPINSPRNQNDVISPAIKGTLNVLNACAETGTVKRVVLTSSVAAIALTDDSHRHTEQDWTPLGAATTPAYVKSKVLAERAAWDLVTSLEENERFEFAVVNPGLVVGPLLLKKINGSLHLIKSILNSEMKAIPDLWFSAIHIDDVISAHISAMESPQAIGHRHIIADSNNMSLAEIATIIRDEFSSQGYRKIPSRALPKSVLWPLQFINQDIKTMYPILGKQIMFDNSRMRKFLHVRPERDSIRRGILESCYSLIEEGFVPKARDTIITDNQL